MKTGVVAIQDPRTLVVIRQNRQDVCGDRRYAYVAFKELIAEDRQRAKGRYPHMVAHLPDEEYLYPVTVAGRLADARRYMPADRAKDLYDLHQVRQVMES
jgi:hypothetical protein